MAYRKSIGFQLFSSLLFTVFSGLYLWINIFYGRVWMIALFGLFIVFFAGMSLLLGLDMRDKRLRTMQVKVVQVKGPRMKVLRPGGRIRAIRVSPKDPNHYEADQLLDLTLTRRTGQILGITIAASDSSSEMPATPI